MKYDFECQKGTVVCETVLTSILTNKLFVIYFLFFYVFKATAGGGGRGMRLAKQPDEFVKLLQVLLQIPVAPSILVDNISPFCVIYLIISRLSFGS